MGDDRKPEDFTFYKTWLKPELQKANPSLYNSLLSKEYVLKAKPFGVSIRENVVYQAQIQRDVDDEVSIFDSDAFRFYLMKYSEQLGVETLACFLSTDRTFSYETKRRIIDFVIRSELELGI